MGRDRVLGHTGAWPDVRARAVWRHTAGAAAGSGCSAAIYVGKLVGIVAFAHRDRNSRRPTGGAVVSGEAIRQSFADGERSCVFGTIGFASVGTLFAAMLARARSRDVLLPILLYPVTIPVMIAGVRGTSALLDAEPQLDMARLWIMLLVSFDVVFVTLSLWTFESADDRVTMRKAFVPLLAVAGLIFMTAPIIIARAPFESTMGLVQKIFYFHMPPAMLMLLSAIFCGGVSAIFLIKRRPDLRLDGIRCGGTHGAVRRDSDGDRARYGRVRRGVCGGYGIRG